MTDTTTPNNLPRCAYCDKPRSDLETVEVRGNGGTIFRLTFCPDKERPHQFLPDCAARYEMSHEG